MQSRAPEMHASTLCRSWRLCREHPQLQPLIKPQLASPQPMNTLHCLESPHMRASLQVHYSTAHSRLCQPGNCLGLCRSIIPILLGHNLISSDHPCVHSPSTRLNCWLSHSHKMRLEAHMHILPQRYMGGRTLCQHHMGGRTLCQRHMGGRTLCQRHSSGSLVRQCLDLGSILGR